MVSSYTDLDWFKLLNSTNDVKARLAFLDDFVRFLDDPTSNLRSIDNSIIDRLLLWIKSSNFKVARGGLEVLCQLCDRMGSDFKAFVPIVLTGVIDRFGDSKETVREQCRLLILKIIEKKAAAPQNVLEKMIPCFSYKNIYMKDEILNLLRFAINHCNIPSVCAIRFLPFVAKLLLDPCLSVRENSFKCLQTMYRHMGEKLRAEFLRGSVSSSIPPQKLVQILKKFDDMRSSGELLSHSVLFEENLPLTEELQHSNKFKGKDDTAVVVNSNFKPSSFKPLNRLKGGISVQKNTKSLDYVRPIYKNTEASVPVQLSYKAKKSGLVKKSVTSTSAGSVDENYFIKAFDENIEIQLHSDQEIEGILLKIKEIIGNDATDWNKRVQALKKVRGLVRVRAASFKEFPTRLCLLEPAFEKAVRDLRSQVVREVCITIAFLSKMLENKFDCFAEFIMPNLVALVMNAAKIVSSCGYICLQFILQYTQSPRLVPIIVNHFSSKSKEIRRAMCKLINLIINTWTDHLLKKCSSMLEDGIKKGIADADSEARDFARSSYWAFQKHFPEQADAILNHIEPGYQRTLLMEGESVSFNNSTQNVEQTLIVPKSYQKQVRQGSLITLKHVSGIVAQSVHSKSFSELHVANTDMTRSPLRTLCQKSRSDKSIFLTRITLPKQQLVSFGAGHKTIENLSSRNSRSKLNNCSKSHSEKNLSRSATQYSNRENHYLLKLDQSLRSRVAQPRLPDDANHKFCPMTSTAFHGFKKKLDISTDVSHPRSVRVGKSFQTSLVTENILSETEKHNEGPTTKTLNQIIENCESTCWVNRKKGLLGLKVYLQSGYLLEPSEIKRVTDNFTKMFADSHTKDFSLFLETLNDIIIFHKTELNSWLYVLMTRLLIKLGGEFLPSFLRKIYETLDNIHISFPNDIQMFTLLKFLSDSTQTPNLKVKIAALNYITKLTADMEELNFPPSICVQVNDIITAALAKMIDWVLGSNNIQDRELKLASCETIIALFNLDKQKMMVCFSCLPKELQEAVTTLINGRSTQSGDNSSPRITPISLSCVTTENTSIFTLTPPENKLCTHVENSAIAHNFLHQTTYEIKNFCFEWNSTNNDKKEISQNSSVDNLSSSEINFQLSHWGQNLETCGNLSNNYSMNMGISTETNCYQTAATGNLIKKDRFVIELPSNFENIDEQEAVFQTVQSLKSVMEHAHSINKDFPQLYCRVNTSLTRLIHLIRNSNCVAIMHFFKSILCVIFTLLNSNEQIISTLVLELLTEMLIKKEFVNSFNEYVELLVLRLFKLFKDGAEDVQRCSETCIETIASILDPELIIRVLVPLLTEDYPVNLCSIKTLTMLVKTRGSDPVQNHLTELMPELIKAYDNEESSVRKSAVFCMVALHINVGNEPLRPYLSSLSGSKWKLLQLYIKRAGDSFVPEISKYQPTLN